jgi:GntR family transcriptional regulator
MDHPATPRQLDRGSTTPLYRQIEAILRERIGSGEWGENAKIPSENELCALYGLSRMTLRGVIGELVSEGLLFRIQGKGTYVSPRKLHMESTAYAGIREQLERMGLPTHTRLTAFRQIAAGAKVGAMLALEPESPVQYIQRVRYIREQPVSIHRTYLPLALCRRLDRYDLEGRQLCHILQEHYGLRARSSTQTLESARAQKSEARLLEIRQGDPVLLLEEVNRLENRRVFEFTQVLFRGDQVKLQFDYDMD